jgi:predicted nucleic acid-binding protein
VILVDTGPLVALCDPRDALNTRARRDLRRATRRGLCICSDVFTEACALLPHAIQRQRLRRILADLPILPLATDDLRGFWFDAFEWLQQFADHDPDWVDACLAVASQRDPSLVIWSYDRGFETIWRRPDGTRIPLLK